MMSYTIPKNINWEGYGKSRLSKVSFPEPLDEYSFHVYVEDDVEDLEDVNDDGYVCLPSSSMRIRTPVSIKNYKRSQPIVIRRKKTHTHKGCEL